MLCARYADAASKHGNGRMADGFGGIYRAMQHTPGGCMSPLKLNYRYFFITHCPVCCCR